MTSNTTTTTEQLDHDAAQRHAHGILKRGSAFSNPARNLARCYLANDPDREGEAILKMHHADEVAALRDEVDRYRELAHELAFMVANLTSSKVPQ